MSASAPDRFWRDWNSRGGVQVPHGGLTLVNNSAIKGGQTSYNVGTGFWLGMVNGIGKFSIGNPSGNYLTWDGTTLTLAGTLALGVPWSTVTDDDGNKPANNADVTLSAVNGGLSVTGGGITLSGGGSIKGGKTGYASGTGFFLGWAGDYVFDIGSTTNYLRWTGSAVNLVGNISGTSTIDITGVAYFSGQTPGVGGVSTALYGNYALDSVTGVLGKSDATLASHGSTGIGLHGVGTGTEASGVIGVSDNRMGVSGLSGGTAPNGIGVRAYNSSSGYGLYADSASGYGIYCNGLSYFNQNMIVNGTVTATAFYGALTGSVTGSVTGSSGSCTGNAATATTAAACSGNSATATTAAACSGNSATATTAGDVTNASGAKLICGTYNTNMQNDGNLVVYHGATPYWDATTDLSDGKFKEAIVPTKHAGLDVINGLRVVDYKWKQDIPVTIKNKDKLKTGFIAQEVQELVPDAVNDIDGTLLLHKEELVPYLVKAVQELSEQVKAMQIEIQALKSK
jgi:hypothetical protein